MQEDDLEKTFHHYLPQIIEKSSQIMLGPIFYVRKNICKKNLRVFGWTISRSPYWIVSKKLYISCCPTFDSICLCLYLSNYCQNHQKFLWVFIAVCHTLTMHFIFLQVWLSYIAAKYKMKSRPVAIENVVQLRLLREY